MLDNPLCFAASLGVRVLMDAAVWARCTFWIQVFWHVSLCLSVSVPDVSKARRSFEMSATRHQKTQRHPAPPRRPEYSATRCEKLKSRNL
jgi:hypothetical protein